MLHQNRRVHQDIRRYGAGKKESYRKDKFLARWEKRSQDDSCAPGLEGAPGLGWNHKGKTHWRWLSETSPLPLSSLLILRSDSYLYLASLSYELMNFLISLPCFLNSFKKPISLAPWHSLCFDLPLKTGNWTYQRSLFTLTIFLQDIKNLQYQLR